MTKTQRITGRVYDCSFPCKKFSPQTACEGQLVRALSPFLKRVLPESVVLPTAIRVMRAVPKFRDILLWDDYNNDLPRLFKEAYRQISGDRAFNGVRSAIPYCFTGAPPHHGHTFFYKPNGALAKTHLSKTEESPIIFLHGYGGNLLWNIWALKKEFPTHPILVPSGGIAWPSRSAADILKYLDDACACVRKNYGITMQSPWLMALSGGGPVAFEVAEFAPERFKGLISIASRPTSPSQLRFPPQFPILMINAEKDERFPFPASRRSFELMRRRKINIHFSKVDDANHFFFLSKRVEMGRLIRKFWDNPFTCHDEGSIPEIIKRKKITVGSKKN